MFLWVDPWIKKLWFAIIDDKLSIKEAWIIKFDEKWKINRIQEYKRMLEVRDFFLELYKKYDLINVFSIEKYFFTKFNKSNAEFVYWLRWILVSMALEKWLKIFEYTPQEIKKNITWNWQAWKLLIQKTIQKIFNLKDLPVYHDASDAIALAYLWLNASRKKIF